MAFRYWPHPSVLRKHFRSPGYNPRIMKIYTKTGDDGTTGPVGGARVHKSDLRIECYGTVDELNAAIGLVAVVVDADRIEMLRQVQSDLFVIRSSLALPAGEMSPSRGLPSMEDSMTARLEHQIDAAEATLPKLQNFIL